MKSNWNLESDYLGWNPCSYIYLLSDFEHATEPIKILAVFIS